MIEKLITRLILGLVGITLCFLSIAMFTRLFTHGAPPGLFPALFCFSLVVAISGPAVVWLGFDLTRDD